MIRFACPGCQTAYSVGDDKAGRTSKCPKCGTPFTVPASSTLPAPAAGSAPAAPKPTAPKPPTPAAKAPPPPAPKAAPKPPPPPEPDEDEEDAAWANAAQEEVDSGPEDNDDFAFGSRGGRPSQAPKGKAGSRTAARTRVPVKDDRNEGIPPTSGGYAGDENDDEDADVTPKSKKAKTAGKQPLPKKGGGLIMIFAGLVHLGAFPGFLAFGGILLVSSGIIFGLLGDNKDPNFELVSNFTLPLGAVATLIGILALPAAIGCFMKKKFGKMLSLICGSLALLLGIAIILLVWQYLAGIGEESQTKTSLGVGLSSAVYFLISALAGFSKAGKGVAVEAPSASKRGKFDEDDDDDKGDVEEATEAFDDGDEEEVLPSPPVKKPAAPVKKSKPAPPPPPADEYEDGEEDETPPMPPKKKPRN